MTDTTIDHTLRGLQVAMLATDGFEQSELIEPLKALEAAGADVSVISVRDDNIRGWNHAEWGAPIAVDTTIAVAA